MFFVFLGLALADLVFLGVWFYHGFQVRGDPVIAERHQIGGLLVCILTCFVHAVTFVYFLGTGLAVKEARKNWGIATGYLRHTRRFKLQAYPMAMVSIALIVTTGILGGAVRSGSVNALVHRGFAIAAAVASAVAFFVAARTILRNGFMMGLIRGDIEKIKSLAEAGEVSLLASGEVPELLKQPDELKRPPAGFLAARALVFLGLSSWLLYAYLQWFLHVPWVTWVPFTILSGILLAIGVYLKTRHPLPAEVDF